MSHDPNATSDSPVHGSVVRIFISFMFVHVVAQGKISKRKGNIGWLLDSESQSHCHRGLCFFGRKPLPLSDGAAFNLRIFLGDGAPANALIMKAETVTR